MKIVVVGSGYVGLVTGACFAEHGNTVTCVDIDEKKVNLLKNGQSPIYEPGLDELIRRNANEERLFFTTSLADAMQSVEVIFIAVGTPPGEDDFHTLHGIGKTGSEKQAFFICISSD